MSIFSLYTFGVCVISLGGIAAYIYYLKREEKKQQENIRQAEEDLGKLANALKTIKQKKEEKEVSVKSLQEMVDMGKEGVQEVQTPQPTANTPKKVYPKKTTKPRSNKRK